MDFQFVTQLLVQHGAEEHAGKNFVFRPSPGLMLFSCLVFGCCVSSFSHRRQNQDPFQFLIYIVLLGAAGAAGYGARAHAHLILLGYLPFATCAAMIISILGHAIYRRLKHAEAPRQEDEEKARLLG
ncbi:uncharacterized protein THITE_2121561 [Thermothielavioides terrestris NRRL 8126]|uniref:Uncharacterized protein n=1 Tax=Thermothielavioides terrestris (strain ATCC 38088 / NRRL 8126) TaxID=578455 RepID=G2RF25_THETT|nr:uncharacterized protein THITE_2121561 [Thermothielavioides terrestris NRRL 8126]AEO70308.1 hypothetical protein THITE_2121561 [Thermothielavioides terrestris NRRL 8126]